jgi:hypothetical protein
MLIVDIYTLGTINLLDFPNQVSLYSPYPLDLEDLMGVYRTFG